jgi:hypothetical protein
MIGDEAIDDLDKLLSFNAFATARRSASSLESPCTPRQHTS